jgi:rubrerythrin
MATQLTLKDILEGAIQKEIDSRLLYQDLSQSINDQAAKQAFQELAEQELGHQNLLDKYLRGEIREGALNIGEPVDYHIAEKLEQPKVSPDMKLKDVFLLAASREKLAHDFYVALAGIHPDGQAKGLLEDLASQEMGHKRRVEFLYTEVAFPQTDGG